MKGKLSKLKHSYFLLQDTWSTVADPETLAAGPCQYKELVKRNLFTFSQ